MNGHLLRHCVFTLLAFAWTATETPIVADDLADGFADPPPAARPAAYWAWLNGSVDRAQLTRELEEMKAKGVSKYYIFECGAKDPDGVIPAGPAFMGKESLEDIGHAIREAGRLGMELGFTTSSSWNCGGSWVEPKHASMGLFQAEVKVEGGKRFSDVLPFPKTPAKAPKRPDGLPKFYKDVAVLAVPDSDRVPGYEFVLELAPPGPHTIERVVLYNTQTDKPDRLGPMQRFAKDFSVSVSATTPDHESSTEVLRATLKPTTAAQEFKFQPVEARHVKLTILSGHNPKDGRIELAEFEAYDPAGKNVALKYFTDGSGSDATLLRFTSEASKSGDWSAGNIHDGAKSSPDGSWRSGPPPAVIENIGSVVNLTDRMDEDGRLTWDVPPGKWTVMRFVCTNTGQGLAVPSPNSHGLAIDHFSADATRMHFQYLIDKLQGEVGPLKDTALSTMYVCSYELRGAVWTPDFIQQFQQRRGYDMTPYLPCLFGSTLQDRQIAGRFDYDYRKTQGDLLVDAFYKTARDMSNKYGLQLCAEAGGPGPPTHNVPVDALKAQGVMDIPRGEFWTDLHLWVVKETACAAHVYGKQFVDMEAFTSWRHWQDGPFDLKPCADRAICDGTNHFTFHTSPHVPPAAGMPGWVYHAGTHMGPSLAWWPKAGAFLDYLARCSYLLQQGLFVGDVCYYYGDQAYNFVPPKHDEPSLGPGYDYDVANAEVILTRMAVKDGRIVLPDGMSYELLVLPNRPDMDLDVLRKLEQLVRAGATIVGPKPIRSNGLDDFRTRDAAVKELADKLWGPCNGTTVTSYDHGRGHVIWGRTLGQIFEARGIGPDFQFHAADETELDFIHRRVGESHVYFVSNQTPRWANADCEFRVRGRAPELWLPETGEIRPLVVYRDAPQGTVVPLRLPPSGSVFVVFRRQAREPYVVLVGGRPDVCQVSRGGQNTAKLLAFEGGTYTLKTDQGKKIRAEVKAVPAERQISGPWKVSFPEGLGAPKSATFDKLISWTDSKVDGIKYFSGMAIYEKEFDAPAQLLTDDSRLFLDLGQVGKVAEVNLNGQPLGIVWKPPHRVDITDAVRTGQNRLVIEVANTWSNRLVGDANSPDAKPFCSTNMKKSLTWKVSWKDTPLLQSGLIGPVRLISAREVSVELPP